MMICYMLCHCDIEDSDNKTNTFLQFYLLTPSLNLNTNQQYDMSNITFNIEKTHYESCTFKLTALKFFLNI